MKRGIVKVSEEISKDYKLMAMLFSNFRVLKFDFMFWPVPYYYFLLEGDRFCEVKEGEEIPKYEVMVQYDESGNPKLTGVEKY